MKMEEWKECKLKDIVEINPTESLKKGTVAKKIGMDILQPYCRAIPSFSFEPYTGGTKFKNGDTIMARITPCLENGKTAMVNILDDNEIGFGSTEYIVFRAKNNITDPYFIYYLVTSDCIRNPAIKSMVGSSGRQRVQTDVVANLSIKLPPLPTQQKIAAILSSLDDKIELNNKINTNLEQQAQALFKNWFVDFEPFGTEEKIESPIGTMIPRSLRMVQVADIPHLLETGKRPKGGAVAEGVPSVGAENVKQLGVFDFSSNKFIPREYADALGKGKINGYELLLYKDGSKPGTFIPHFSMFGEGFPYDECYINEHVFKLDFYDKGLNEFAYFYFNTEYVKNWLANNGGKAAIPEINQNDVNAIWIYDLENPKVKEFAKFVEPLFKKIFSNCKQNRELSTIRDTLLPKLMNGEIETNSNIISKE